MNKEELIKKIETICWERFTQDDLNKHTGYEREILLHSYWAWLWRQRHKKKRAIHEQEIVKQLLTIL